jgi:hypothetical protein
MLCVCLCKTEFLRFGEFLMNKFLLTVSVLSFLTSSVSATWKQDVEEQTELEVGAKAIIQKFFHTKDYVLDLKENQLVNTIVKVVSLKNDSEIGHDDLTQSDIERETYRQFSNKLDYLKKHKVHIGGGWSTTINKHDDLCVELVGIPLVYATSSAGRERNDSFLPIGYQSSYLSKPLYEEIEKYTQAKGLDKASTKRLYAYLEPLFYLVQEEVKGMIGGLPNSKWSKSYEDFLKTLKSQTDHHLYMNSHLKVKIQGLSRNEAMEALTPSLLGKAVSVIPSPHRVIHKDEYGGYILALNVKGDLCVVHPINGIHYPVFTKDTNKGDMHLPLNFATNAGLYKQWNRVSDFIEGHDKLLKKDKKTVHKLLEAVGYLANEHFQNLRIDISDDLLVETLQNFMNELKQEPKEDFPYRMHRDLFRDDDIQKSLRTLRDKVETHNEMIQPYYPISLRSWDKDMLSHAVMRHLLHNEIVDRLSEKLKDKFNAFAEELRKARY